MDMGAPCTPPARDASDSDEDIDIDVRQDEAAAADMHGVTQRSRRRTSRRTLHGSLRAMVCTGPFFAAWLIADTAFADGDWYRKIIPTDQEYPFLG